MFEYDFMQRALVAGVLLAVSAALIGIPLVLRRKTMLSDGLSHVAFGSIALASVIGIAPLFLSIPLTLLASFLTLKISKNRKIHGDAIIAILSVSALAFGVFVSNLRGGSGIDLNSYLFGSILSLNNLDVIFAGILALFTVAIFCVFYRKIFAISFDEEFAQSIGVKTEKFNVLFSILSSLVVVIGMRLTGSLLISALLIFPVLSATQIVKNFKTTVWLSVVLGIFNFVIGLIISYFIDMPAGATIVLFSLLVFIFAKFVGWTNSRI